MLEITEEELKKILPTDGPSIGEVRKYLKKYNDERSVSFDICNDNGEKKGFFEIWL